jgi:hypothetical protein
MTSDGKPVKKSWNTKVPTDGGPVSYLNIFDRQSEIRIPEELPMGDGIYRYSYTGHQYRWHPTRLSEPE